MNSQYPELAQALTDLLNLKNPPLAITFSDTPPEKMPLIDDPMPAPTADGRTGRVPAGCVFWIKAETRAFTTTAEDHGNCSVGSVTHGFKTLDEVAKKSDIACLVEAGWVSPDVFPFIPVIKKGSRYVSYGPLHSTEHDPDVVFMRLNAKQAMSLSDAVPELSYNGKPQCHIIAIAKQQQQVAMSVGCMLSRVRTGMPNTEMTAAIPARRLDEVVRRLRMAMDANKRVSAYASEDTRRFGQQMSSVT
ncbi:DUF169 domain-containing protein [Kaarinaea lacus]